MYQYKISPKLIELDLNNVHKYCHKDNRFLSFFMFSMSTLFPVGESNFITLANLIKSRITNSDKKKQIDLFVEQEKNHQKIHKKYNDQILKNISCSRFINKRELFIKKLTKSYFRRNKNNYSLFAYRLYISEKYSEAVGLWFLDINSEFLPEEKKLWTWHSYEEIEHNFLSGELLSNYTPPSKLSILNMKLKITSWFIEIFMRTIVFSYKDGLFKNFYFYKDIFRFFFTYKYFPKLFIYIIKTILFGQELANKEKYFQKLIAKQSS